MEQQSHQDMDDVVSRAEWASDTACAAWTLYMAPLRQTGFRLSMEKALHHRRKGTGSGPACQHFERTRERENIGEVEGSDARPTQKTRDTSASVGRYLQSQMLLSATGTVFQEPRSACHLHQALGQMDNFLGFDWRRQLLVLFLTPLPSVAYSSLHHRLNVCQCQARFSCQPMETLRFFLFASLFWIFFLNTLSSTLVQSSVSSFLYFNLATRSPSIFALRLICLSIYACV